jgi:uncharacterized protein (TIGR03083 family)
MTLGNDVGAHYRATRERLGPFVLGLTETQLATPVPCLPGWTVRDTMGHVVGIVDDGVAGRIKGIPDDTQTAAQVERMRGYGIGELVEMWNTYAPFLEDAVSKSGMAPAAGDIVTHEHDIRGALSMPGARDSETVGWFADRLMTGAGARLDQEGRGGFMVLHDAGSTVVGSIPSELTLTTSRFEIFRAFIGRRSRSQLLHMNWSGPADAIVDHLHVFNCPASDIIE